ncbi:MAG TPA: tetratricopeptide repeat protein [Acidobacteriota bacterium]|nr:tetratricopeptide repeat protein [Acidobacteriota bacterium]
MTTAEYIQQSKDAIKNNDILRAEALLREAVSADAKSVEAKAELARVLLALSKIPEANQVVDEGLALNNKHAFALSIKGSLKVLDEKYSEAIQLLKSAVEIDPSLATAYVNLGIAQREAGFVKDAEANIRKAIAMNPNDYEAHFVLGHTLFIAEKFEDGILATIESIKINPGFVKGYLALGGLYNVGGRPDLAEQLYDECLKRIPEAIIVREKLQELYLEHKKFDAAQGEMELIAHQRGTIDDWMKLGNISIIARKFKVAELAFRKAAEMEPEAWEPHYNLGDLYDAAGLIDAAGKEYELAVKFNSGSYKPHNGMGLWLMRQNKLEESITQLTKAHQQAPSAPEPAYNLALVLVKANQTEQAKGLLKEVVTNPKATKIAQDAQRLLCTL